MSSKNIPRLFINKELKAKIKIKLNSNNKHYLKNVLRLYNGDFVKIFNGLDGEWKASFKREKEEIYSFKSKRTFSLFTNEIGSRDNERKNRKNDFRKTTNQNSK